MSVLRNFFRSLAEEDSRRIRAQSFDLGGGKRLEATAVMNKEGSFDIEARAVKTERSAASGLEALLASRRPGSYSSSVTYSNFKNLGRGVSRDEAKEILSRWEQEQRDAGLQPLGSARQRPASRRNPRLSFRHL